MPKRIDLTNKKVGKLVIVHYEQTISGKAYWLTKCDCGNEKVIRGTHLRSGRTRGCLRGGLIDLTGKKFGRLIVIRRAGYNGKEICWFTKCDCGNEKVITGANIRTGITKSCGCLQPKIVSEKMKSEKNPMWKGDDVGYSGLHIWIKNHKPKPSFCERCEIKEPFDLANISGQYLRDINDFEWLCRSCHMKDDGRLAALIGKKTCGKKE